nr:TVP38/TMEM64 family protein [Streptomyces sp. HNM0574]
MLSPWARLVLLVVLLGAAAVCMLVYEPQELLTSGFPGHLSGGEAVVLFGGAYGVFTAAFVPRPVLNIAAGAVFGAQAGTASALAGTVLGASLAMALGRLLGQDALRPLLRARWLALADRQLSRHGFRSTLVLRLMPGVPFAASNYAAGVSRIRWPGFLTATTLGSVPNTAAYVVAGSSARSPTSPVFLASFGFIALSALGGALIAWRKRAHLRGAAARAQHAAAADGESPAYGPEAGLVPAAAAAVGGGEPADGRDTREAAGTKGACATEP